MRKILIEKIMIYNCYQLIPLYNFRLTKVTANNHAAQRGQLVAERISRGIKQRAAEEIIPVPQIVHIVRGGNASHYCHNYVKI